MVIGYRVVAHAWKSTEVIERLGKVLLPLLDSLKKGPQKTGNLFGVIAQNRAWQAHVANLCYEYETKGPCSGSSKPVRLERVMGGNPNQSVSSVCNGVGWRAQLFPTRVRFFCLCVR